MFLPTVPWRICSSAALWGSPRSLWKLLAPQARTTYCFQVALSTQLALEVCIAFCWTPARAPYACSPHAGCLFRASGSNSWMPWPPTCFCGIQMGTGKHSSEGCNSSWLWRHHRRWLLLNNVQKICSIDVARVGQLVKGRVSFYRVLGKSNNQCQKDKLRSSCLDWSHPESFGFVVLQANYLILLMLLLHYWSRSVLQLYHLISWA